MGTEKRTIKILGTGHSFSAVALSFDTKLFPFSRRRRHRPLLEVVGAYVFFAEDIIRPVSPSAHFEKTLSSSEKVLRGLGNGEKVRPC